MWKKVLYFGIMTIIGIMVWTLCYNSNQYNHIYELTVKAIEEKNYSELPKIFGGCFDTNEVELVESEKMDAVIYAGTASTDEAYTVQEEQKRYLVYEEAYYLYIFNSSYSYINIMSGEEYTNQTALVFNCENGEYIYPFVVDSSINSTYYVANPTTVEELILNDSRNLIATHDNWNFMSINITKTMVDLIEAKYGEINNFRLVDNEGNTVHTFNNSLDFADQFYTDVRGLIDNYNVYLQDYLAGTQGAEDKFNSWYTPWLEEFEESKETTGYSFRYEDDYIMPSSIVWQTVGMLALYIVSVLLVYFVLFHFKDIKRLFSKESYKDYKKSR